MLNQEISKSWDVDPQKVGVYFFTFPDNAIGVESLDWAIQRFPYFNFRIAFYPDKPLSVARNLAAVKFLQDPAKFDWMLLVDRDVKPDWRSDFMFQGPQDASCCVWDDDRPWFSDRSVFHMSLAMIHRRVFEGLELPYFDLPTSDDGLRLISCDCAYFAKKAESAGFKLGSNGYVVHKSSRSWCGR